MAAIKNHEIFNLILTNFKARKIEMFIHGTLPNRIGKSYTTIHFFSFFPLGIKSQVKQAELHMSHINDDVQVHDYPPLITCQINF